MKLTNFLPALLRASLGRNVYADEVCPTAVFPDPQMCAEAIQHVPAGAIDQPLIHWVNRPTFQRVVEVQGHRPR